MRELEKVAILILSLIVFVILIPFKVALWIIGRIKTLLTIAEKTINTFIESMGEELLK